MPDLGTLLAEPQTRTLHVRSFDADTREFTGIAVPWDQVTNIAGLWDEKFERGSIEDSDDATLFYGHAEPIGVLTKREDAEGGWTVTGRISKTTRGNDVYTLLQDGALDSLSIRFDPIEYRVDENDVVIHTRARVREVSVVPFPAYTGAKVSEVRSAAPRTAPLTEGDTMPDALTRDDLDAALAAERAESKREFDALTARLGSGTVATPQFRSLAHFLKALAGGDDNAMALHREYTGAGLADAVNANVWLADAIRLVEKRRPVLGTFAHDTLPPKGMTLEYAKLKSDTTKVEKQAKEGDALPFGKIQLTTASTNVGTYGGYSEVSRQTIDRAETAYLNTLFKAMSIRYGVETESAARAVFLGTVASERAAGHGLTIDWATAERNDVLDVLVDAVGLYDDNGFSLDGGFVAKDVFKHLVHLEDSTGRPVMNVTGQGVNQTGSISVKQLSGAVADISFRMLANAPAGTAAFYDADAITIWESSGAPYQLQDDDVIHLTRDYSVYGYLAGGAQFPEAIVPVGAPAAPVAG
jgi:hypothetical protein